jgi:hypothetical protein
MTPGYKAQVLPLQSQNAAMTTPGYKAQVLPLQSQNAAMTTPGYKAQVLPLQSQNAAMTPGQETQTTTSRSSISVAMSKTNITLSTPVSQAAHDCNATSSPDEKVTSPCKSRVQPLSQHLDCASIIAQPQVHAFCEEQPKLAFSRQADVLPVDTQEELNEQVSELSTSTCALPPQVQLQCRSDIGNVQTNSSEEFEEPQEHDDGFVPAVGEDEDSTITSPSQPVKVASQTTQLKRDTNQTLLEYARQCAPALYQAMGIGNDEAPPNAMIETLLGMFQGLTSINAEAKTDAGSGTKSAPVDVELYTPDKTKAKLELAEQRKIASDLARRASASPTAHAIHEIQKLVGTSLSAITLRLPPVAYAYTTVAEDQRDGGFSVFMRNIQTLEAGEMLDDTVLEIILRAKNDENGWTLNGNRALIPLTIAETLKNMRHDEDNSESLLLNFPFLMSPDVQHIIWILWYDYHWVTCVASTNGSIKIYNSKSGYNHGNIAGEHSLHQISILTSSVHVHEQWRGQTWTVEFPPCPQQHNNVDCGIYAAECALDLFKTSSLASEARNVPSLRLEYIQVIQMYVQQAIDSGDFEPTVNGDQTQPHLDHAQNDSHVSIRDIIAQLPLASEKEIQAAHFTHTLWTGHFEDDDIPRVSRTLIWDRSRRSRQCILLSFLDSMPDKTATREELRDAYLRAPDSRGHAKWDLKYIEKQGYISPIAGKHHQYVMTVRSYQPFGTPIPLFRIAEMPEIPVEPSLSTHHNNEYDQTHTTVYICQIRMSSPIRFLAALALKNRSKTLWKAYKERFPLPKGVNVVDITGDTSKWSRPLGPNLHGYIRNIQTNHSSNQKLLCNDSDETIARRFLDETSRDPTTKLHVVIIGNGLDGLSSNNETWHALTSRWPNFTFEICLLLDISNCQMLKYLPQVITTRDHYVAVVRTPVTELDAAYTVMQERGHDKIPRILDDIDVATNLNPHEAFVYAMQLVFESKNFKREWARQSYSGLYQESALYNIVRRLLTGSMRNQFFLGLRPSGPIPDGSHRNSDSSSDLSSEDGDSGDDANANGAGVTSKGYECSQCHDFIGHDEDQNLLCDEDQLQYGSVFHTSPHPHSTSTTRCGHRMSEQGSAQYCMWQPPSQEDLEQHRLELHTTRATRSKASQQQPKSEKSKSVAPQQPESGMAPCKKKDVEGNWCYQCKCLGLKRGCDGKRPCNACIKDGEGHYCSSVKPDYMDSPIDRSVPFGCDIRNCRYRGASQYLLDQHLHCMHDRAVRERKKRKQEQDLATANYLKNKRTRKGDQDSDHPK